MGRLIYPFRLIIHLQALFVTLHKYLIKLHPEFLFGRSMLIFLFFFTASTTFNVFLSQLSNFLALLVASGFSPLFLNKWGIYGIQENSAPFLWEASLPLYHQPTNQYNAPSQFHFRTKSWYITQVLNPCFLILLVNYSYSYGFLRSWSGIFIFLLDLHCRTWPIMGP